MVKKNAIKKTAANLPAPVIDYGTDAGAGVLDIGRDEAGIPFLKILQAQSPEVIGPNGKLEGASAGVILNTGTEEMLDNVTVIPACRQHVYVEWRPRKKGGGIVAIHEKTSDVVAASLNEWQTSNRKFGDYKVTSTEEGGGLNDLVETFYVFSVILKDDQPEGFVVVPFSSTGIKIYKKKFINRVRYTLVDNGQGKKVTPPMFAHRITLGTAQETNDDGTWSNYTLQFAVDNNVQKSLMKPGHAGYEAAKELKTMVDGGTAKVDTSKAGEGSSDGGDETDSSAF